MEYLTCDKKNLVILGLLLAVITLIVYSYRLSNSENNTNVKPVVEKMENDKRIVLYKAEWCGHSQAIKPVWNAVKDNLSNVITVETIDCDEEKAKCGSVSGFPTIVLYNGKTKIEYSGDRSFDSIKKFIDSNK